MALRTLGRFGDIASMNGVFKCFSSFPFGSFPSFGSLAGEYDFIKAIVLRTCKSLFFSKLRIPGVFVAIPFINPSFNFFEVVKTLLPALRANLFKVSESVSTLLFWRVPGVSHGSILS